MNTLVLLTFQCTELIICFYHHHQGAAKVEVHIDIKGTFLIRKSHIYAYISSFNSKSPRLYLDFSLGSCY